MRKLLNTHYLILTAIFFLIFIFRFPSLFEPFWYGDEGIFAAVGRNLNQGGVLYQTAWDNKPPMIYLTYQIIFKFFGVSMFWLRLTTIIFVLATACVIYEITKAILSEKRALVATFIFGFLTSLRLIEGNLALTEIFMILPITLAMFLVIYRKFDYFSLFGAGSLFAIASLYKQVGALEAAALGIFLFISSRTFWEFVKRGIALGIGFIIPYLLTILYFAPKNLLGDYIFAAYTYYRIYLGESPKYALLINILKFLPIVSAAVYGIFKKFKSETHDVSSNKQVFHLILLWTAFSFLGSYFSGRTYGHYMVQAVPALSILVASISLKPKLRFIQVGFALSFFIPLVFLTKILFTDFLTAGPLNQLSYWRNFIDFTFGNKNINAYNDFFDRNVNSIMALSDFLYINRANNKSVYIWGDYPWLYAISDLKNPSRYVTSFHVFGVPEGPEEVAKALYSMPPEYIIKPESSIGYFGQLEKLLDDNYTFVAQIENSKVWKKAN